jgi:hypothetical protein
VPLSHVPVEMRHLLEEFSTEEACLVCFLQVCCDLTEGGLLKLYNLRTGH